MVHPAVAPFGHREELAHAPVEHCSPVRVEVQVRRRRRDEREVGLGCVLRRCRGGQHPHVSEQSSNGSVAGHASSSVNTLLQTAWSNSGTRAGARPASALVGPCRSRSRGRANRRRDGRDRRRHRRTPPDTTGVRGRTPTRSSRTPIRPTHSERDLEQLDGARALVLGRHQREAHVPLARRPQERSGRDQDAVLQQPRSKLLRRLTRWRRDP